MNEENKYSFNIKNIVTVNPLPKPKYCDYSGCRCLLPSKLNNIENGEWKGRNVFITKIKPLRYYCDRWCYEQDTLMNKKLHYCVKCGEPCKIYVNKGRGGNMFSKYCEKHSRILKSNKLLKK